MTEAIGLLRQPRTILLGRGQREGLNGLLSGARRVLVVTDQRMSTEPIFTELVDRLVPAVSEVSVFSEVPPELPVENVALAGDRYAGSAIDTIVAVGGGSVIDFAKVLAVLFTHGGHPRDYYGEFQVPGPVIPLIALPTTAGTGSEATPVAVLSDAERGTKIGISSPHLIPQVAICDPELSRTAPPGLSAVSGTDALSHCIESYTAARRPATPELSSERVFIGKGVLTDHYALTGIRAIARSLREVVLRTGGSEAFERAQDDMVLGALCGGLALGTGGTAAAHALQYPVGAATHTPHGKGIGTLLPYVMAYNRPARVPEFAEIARAFGATGDNEERLSFQAVESVRELLGAIGIPATLAELGVEAGREDWIAEQALQSVRLVENNPRPLDRDVLRRIAAAAYSGDLALSSDR